VAPCARARKPSQSHRLVPAARRQLLRLRKFPDGNRDPDDLRGLPETASSTPSARALTLRGYGANLWRSERRRSEFGSAGAADSASATRVSNGPGDGGDGRVPAFCAFGPPWGPLRLRARSGFGEVTLQPWSRGLASEPAEPSHSCRLSLCWGPRTGTDHTLSKMMRRGFARPASLQ